MFTYELHGSPFVEAVVSLFRQSIIEHLVQEQLVGEHDAFPTYDCVHTNEQLECVCTIFINSKCSPPQRQMCSTLDRDREMSMSVRRFIFVT